MRAISVDPSQSLVLTESLPKQYLATCSAEGGVLLLEGVAKAKAGTTVTRRAAVMLPV